MKHTLMCLWLNRNLPCHCRGLLIRGGDVLEAASKVDAVVFDKTGTLTRGRPVVTDVHALPGAGQEPGQLLSLAAALERESTHPIARSICRADREAGALLQGRCGRDGTQCQMMDCCRGSAWWPWQGGAHRSSEEHMVGINMEGARMQARRRARQSRGACSTSWVEASLAQ